MATPTIPNTNALKPYVPAAYPNTQDPAALQRFIQFELSKIQNALVLINQVLKQHETRLASGGL